MNTNCKLTLLQLKTDGAVWGPSDQQLVVCYAVSTEVRGLRGLHLQEQEIGNQSNARASQRPQIRRVDALSPVYLSVHLVVMTLSGAHSALLAGGSLERPSLICFLCPCLDPWAGLREMPPEGTTPGDGSVKKSTLQPSPWSPRVEPVPLLTFQTQKDHLWFSLCSHRIWNFWVQSSLCCAWQPLHFHQLKVWGHPVLSVYRLSFSRGIGSLCVSGSHFGESHSISHFSVTYSFWL